MKRYEGLVILNLAGQEEGLKEVVDEVTAEIGSAGGKVEAVQKMDRRPFARVADRRHTAGHYVNVVFEAGPEALAQLQDRFARSQQVFRVLVTEAPKIAVPTAAAQA